MTDPTNIFTAHEMIAQVDGSAVIKFTVQFNLFGGSMVALHTDRHAKYFDLIDNFDIVGCFCLTELGYGNNAVKMETTVTYDKSTQEFVVDSPTALSQKYWITNGVCHSNYALVFGQTIVDGKNEGVNAFLVRVRDDQMKEMPGVQIVDMGVKMGLNGVDNGALKYKNVRIPRENMMNRYADVDASGKFTSDVKGVPQRFFKVTERLLSGRICIASMAVGAARACLYIAIKYAQ
jgi:acyl-CoA oxidase